MGQKAACCCQEDKFGEEKGQPKEWERQRQNTTGADVVPAFVKSSPGLTDGPNRENTEASDGYASVVPAAAPISVPISVPPPPVEPSPPPAKAEPPPNRDATPPPVADTKVTKSDEWQVTVAGGGTLGFHATTVTDALVVQSVEESSAMSSKVKAGDIILEVNGERKDVTMMLGKILAEPRPQLNMTLVRLLEFRICIAKADEPGKPKVPLGIGLTVDEDANLLRVAGIRETGLFAKYNSSCEAGKQIFAEDVILQVNDVRGDANDVLRTMANASEKQFDLIVQRNK